MFQDMSCEMLEKCQSISSIEIQPFVSRTYGGGGIYFLGCVQKNLNIKHRENLVRKLKEKLRIAITVLRTLT